MTPLGSWLLVVEMRMCIETYIYIAGTNFKLVFLNLGECLCLSGLQISGTFVLVGKCTSFLGTQNGFGEPRRHPIFLFCFFGNSIIIALKLPWCLHVPYQVN